VDEERSQRSNSPRVSATRLNKRGTGGVEGRTGDDF